MATVRVKRMSTKLTADCFDITATETMPRLCRISRYLSDDRAVG